MEQVIELGPFMVNTSLLILLLSFVSGYVFIHLQVKSLTVKKELTDTIFNGSVFYILAYKGSLILFYPLLFMQSPIGVLSFPGTYKQVLVALGVLVIYFIFQIRKFHLSVVLLLNSFSLLFIAGGFIYYFLRYLAGFEFESLWIEALNHWFGGSFYISQLFIHFILLLLYMRRKYELSSLRLTKLIVISYFVGQLLFCVLF